LNDTTDIVVWPGSEQDGVRSRVVAYSQSPSRSQARRHVSPVVLVVEVVFRKEMEASSINTGSFALTDGQALVPGQVEYSASRTATTTDGPLGKDTGTQSLNRSDERYNRPVSVGCADILSFTTAPVGSISTFP
jgi:hypothetical protein